MEQGLRHILYVQAHLNGKSRLFWLNPTIIRPFFLKWSDIRPWQCKHDLFGHTVTDATVRSKDKVVNWQTSLQGGCAMMQIMNAQGALRIDMYHWYMKQRLNGRTLQKCQVMDVYSTKVKQSQRNLQSSNKVNVLEDFKPNFQCLDTVCLGYEQHLGLF